MPLWYLQLMSRFSRKRSLVHARHTARLANEVAKDLVQSKAEALLQGKGNKDILSLLGILGSVILLRTNINTLVLDLVKANASEDSSTKLTEEEIYAQMRYAILVWRHTRYLVTHRTQDDPVGRT